MHKSKSLHLGPKLPCLGAFGRNLKNLVILEINVFEFFILQSLLQRKKSLNSESKIVLLGLELENDIVVFEISALKFVQLQNFVKE